MRIKTSSIDSSIIPLECIDRKRNVWRLRWNIEDGEFEEIQLNHMPNLDEVKNIIREWCNEQTVNRITNGFIWKGHRVNLSKENQANYTMFCDSGIVPAMFKFGTWENPEYYKFETVDELKRFKTAFSEHIKTCLQLGWARKDNFNWTPYEQIINNNNNS